MSFWEIVETGTLGMGDSECSRYYSGPVSCPPVGRCNSKFPTDRRASLPRSRRLCTNSGLCDNGSQYAIFAGNRPFDVCIFRRTMAALSNLPGHLCREMEEQAPELIVLCLSGNQNKIPGRNHTT